MTLLTAFLAVMVTGGCGALCRYAVNEMITARYGGSFPLGTFVINGSGSFAAGFVAGVALQSPGLISPDTAAVLLTGFLGGYTTFSTWMLQSADELRNRETGRFLLNVLGSVVFGVCAAWLGLWLGRVLM